MGLRIAEISTLSKPVPPLGEGSVENLVSVITEGLVARGHDVTLFAAANSETTARLCSPVKVPYSEDPTKWDWQIYEEFQVREAFLRHAEFDVIHCHSYHHAMVFCDFVPVPVLMTLHIEPGPDYLFLAKRTHNRHLHFCSQYQARDFDEIPDKSVIHHGIPLFEAVGSHEGPPEDYLAFLGRFLPDKGALEAIHIARESGRRLLLAAPENDYFHAEISRHVDGEQICYIGELGGREKFRFLERASALLYPIKRGEAFGLVLVESLMAGTPVIASNIGAVGEIVEHGVTGFLMERNQDYASAIAALGKLDRKSIRQWAVERFSANRMLDDIEALLVKLARGRRVDG